MPWHGRLSIWLVGGWIMLSPAITPDATGDMDGASQGEASHMSAEPPEPTPSTPAELEQLAWRQIITLLCMIIPCQPADPNGETIQAATACLHIRLDRFELEGLNPDLDQPTIAAWIANTETLIAILTGPDWNDFVFDDSERDGLLVQLLTLESALEASLMSERGVQRD